MNVDQFVTEVEARTDLDGREEVFEAADATLRTLAERVSRGEAEDLAEHVPPELEEALAPAGSEDPEPFPPPEFADRVEQRTSVEGGDADRHVTAVFEGLGTAIDGDEWHDARSQLPAEYGRYFGSEGA